MDGDLIAYRSAQYLLESDGHCQRQNTRLVFFLATIQCNSPESKDNRHNLWVTKCFISSKFASDMLSHDNLGIIDIDRRRTSVVLCAIVAVIFSIINRRSEFCMFGGICDPPYAP